MSSICKRIRSVIEIGALLSRLALPDNVREHLGAAMQRLRLMMITLVCS